MEASSDPGVKAALRRHFRQWRRERLAAAQAGISAVAGRELPALLRPALRLGLYWPLEGEPDLLPLAESLSQPLALPAIVGQSSPCDGGSDDPRRLVYLPWRPGESLVADACGIPAPDPLAALPLAPDQLGLLLVPALAFNPRTGVRLGYGAGWYDRLRAEPAWRAVPALAVLPSACLALQLPRDGWDVPFEGWLDETGLHRVAVE